MSQANRTHARPVPVSRHKITGQRRNKRRHPRRPRGLTSRIGNQIIPDFKQDLVARITMRMLAIMLAALVKWLMPPNRDPPPLDNISEMMHRPVIMGIGR